MSNFSFDVQLESLYKRFDWSYEQHDKVLTRCTLRARCVVSRKALDALNNDLELSALHLEEMNSFLTKIHQCVDAKRGLPVFDTFPFKPDQRLLDDTQKKMNDANSRDSAARLAVDAVPTRVDGNAKARCVSCTHSTLGKHERWSVCRECGVKDVAMMVCNCGAYDCIQVCMSCFGSYVQ